MRRDAGETGRYHSSRKKKFHRSIERTNSSGTNWLGCRLNGKCPHDNHFEADCSAKSAPFCRSRIKRIRIHLGHLGNQVNYIVNLGHQVCRVIGNSQWLQTKDNPLVSGEGLLHGRGENVGLFLRAKACIFDGHAVGRGQDPEAPLGSSTLRGRRRSERRIGLATSKRRAK